MLELLEFLRGLGRRLARVGHPQEVIQSQVDRHHGWRTGAVLGGVCGGIIGMLVLIGPLQSDQMFGVAAFFCLLIASVSALLVGLIGRFAKGAAALLAVAILIPLFLSVAGYILLMMAALSSINC